MKTVQIGNVCLGKDITDVQAISIGVPIVLIKGNVTAAAQAVSIGRRIIGTGTILFDKRVG